MKSKYFNIKSGIFDSKKEEKRYNELLLRQQAGEISMLNYHSKYILIPKQDGERAVEYEADFDYIDNSTGKVMVEDVKSPFTRKMPVYIIKRKLMLYVWKIKIVEV